MSGTQVLRPKILSGPELDRRLADGWYRIGQTLMTCRYVVFNGVLRTAVWARVPLRGFAFKRSHRKLINRVNRRFSITQTALVVDAEHEDLYARYRTVVNGERAASLDEFLYGDGTTAAFETRSLDVRDASGRLVAFSWFDVGERASQSLIGVYHPDHAEMSLGFTSMLLEIRESLARRMDYFYPGYVLPGEPAMDYKLRLSPCEIRDPLTGVWTDAAGLPALALPTTMLWNALRTARHELTNRGVAAELRLYRMFEVGAYNPSLRACLDHPLVLEILPGQAGGSLILVTWSVEDRTYSVVRCQRAVAQVRDRTEDGDQLNRVGLLVVESTLARSNGVRSVVDLVATTVGRGG